MAISSKTKISWTNSST